MRFGNQKRNRKDEVWLRVNFWDVRGEGVRKVKVWWWEVCDGECVPHNWFKAKKETFNSVNRGQCFV
jgi:hypothetical protein